MAKANDRCLASNVLVVILRVAGAVTVEVHPHAIGTPERQVSVRIGDALVYLTDPAAAARIRQQWDAAQPLVIQRLPERVSQTWLKPDLGSFPLGVTARLDRSARVATNWVAGSRANGVPAYLRVQVDRLVWQVCDVEAWRTIGDGWFAAQKCLDQ